jgi:hypothetical protein
MKAQILENAVFWNVAPYTFRVNRRFGGSYRLHLQGRRICVRRTSVRKLLFIVTAVKTSNLTLILQLLYKCMKYDILV